MHREHLGARAAWSEEDGFTLLELMMVILIIAILIAVTMPVFFGATERAKDRAMQASLHNATTGAKSLYLVNADYTTASPAALTAETGNLTFVPAATAPNGANAVSVFPVSSTQLVLAGQSKSGSCFYVLDDEVSGGTSFAKVAGGGGCAAIGAPLPADPAWHTTW